MPPLHEMPFGTRRWVLMLCAVLAGALEIGVAMFVLGRHYGSMRETQLIAWFAGSLIGGSTLAGGLAMWTVLRLWQRSILREFGRALLEADRTRAERAIISLAKIEATQKGVAHVWTCQFQLWCSLEDWCAARESHGEIDFEKLRESRDAAGVAFIALAILETGETVRALSLIEPIVGRMGDAGREGATARAVLGMVLNRMGRHGEAIEQLGKAVMKKPLIVGSRAVFMLGESLMAEGRHQEARAVLQPIAEKTPKTRLGQRAAQHLARTDSVYR